MSQAVKEKLQIALKTEMVGYSYYNDAADIIKDAKGKNVFRHLAAEELDHIKMLMRIADAVDAGRGWIAHTDPAENEDARVNEGLPIFSDKNELLDKLKADVTDINAVTIAMDTEEEAVNFYSAMLKEATEEAEVEVLTKLVEMEKNHFDLLRWELDALTNTGFWADMIEFSVEMER